MSEIDDIKRRAGISEDFGGGTDPVESIVNAHVRANADGPTLMDSINAASGGDAGKAVVITLKIIDRLTNYPGSTQKFIQKMQQGNRTGGYREGGTSGL